MRLIDVDETMAIAKECYPAFGRSMADLTDLREVLEDCTTVDAKPVVHAHWQKYDDSEFCYCSYCGKPSAEDDNVSWHGYCPICGATMDEELERLNCGAQMDEEV